ncbi:hypothetical protein MKW98_029876 [Papaver atlanticum]|uniref:Bidirectional sugar transporter SWEET n=1 Tax=Papaver atlanticum TaxID=357466 RepID=A0AAD4XXK6_9MAGN|nr:hypothetical protein MKW98_029876 [Papaver atlanticum]
MVSAAAARQVVGVLGNVISCGLFLSPLPTFYSIYKKGAVEDYSPNPYVVTVVNCALWIYYGAIHPDSIFVITINAAGLFIELLYIIFYFIYASNKQRKSVGIKSLIGIAGIMLVMLPLSFIPMSKSLQGLLIGLACVIVNIGMYAMPCDAIIQVYKTKSLEYMPLTLSVVGLLNGICWLTYALLRFDLFILLSNGIGFVLGLIQVGVFAYYWFKYPQPKNPNLFKSGYNWLKSKMNNKIVDEKVTGGGKVELSDIV